MSEHSKAWKTRLKNLRESHDDAVRRLHREARRHSKAEAELKAERERVRQMEEALQTIANVYKWEQGRLRSALAGTDYRINTIIRIANKALGREPSSATAEEGEA